MEQLIASGLSIKDSLEILTVIEKKGKVSNLATELLGMIKKGISFASAIDTLKNYFPPVYRGIINVGDRIGSVEKIFPKLRSYLESQKKIKDKISSALLYPILVLFTAVIAFLAMIFFVFPKLKDMFAEFGGTAAIKLEQNINRMQTGLLLFVIIVAVLVFVGYIFAVLSKSNNKIKLFIDSYLLKLPIIGKFIIYRETLNFAFAMETLTASGITIETAINESLSVLSNQVYVEALKDVNNRIIKGESLSQAFSAHKVFPSYLTKWMLVGEKSGKTEQIFSQIKNYFQNEIDLFTSKFMSLFEPALIIIIGVFLVILIITVVVPVFSLYGEII